MWLSNPMTASRLRSPISPSTAATRCPIIARAVLRLAAVVVLPTPPLPDVIVSTRLSMIPPYKRGPGLPAGEPTGIPTFNDNLTIFDRRHLRGLRGQAAIFRGTAGKTANPQLDGRQYQGADHRLLIPRIPGVDGSTQRAPHNHIPSGNDFCSGIDIAHNYDRTGILQPLAGTDRAAGEQGIGDITPGANGEQGRGLARTLGTHRAAGQDTRIVQFIAPYFLKRHLIGGQQRPQVFKLLRLQGAAARIQAQH